MFTEWIAAVSPAPLSGPIEVIKERPWSLVAKVPTADGPLWFKENRGGTRYETYLLAALSRWVPDAVLTPVALDHERGWSLQPDGGSTIHESDATPDPRRWEALLSAHAGLQRRLAKRAAEMVAAGVPDQRPETLMAQFDRLPVPPAVLPLRARLQERCAALANSAVPASLQHDDLHDNNVFTSGKVFDWGDASVSHPFAVLLVSLRVAARQFDAGPGDPRLARIRDAYLEGWSDLADRAALIRDAEDAVELAKIGRAISWHRALMTSPDDAEFGDSVTGWLSELAQPEAIGVGAE
jgi:hypothetical protein